METKHNPALTRLAHVIFVDFADETCRRCGVPAYRTRRGWRHESRGADYVTAPLDKQRNALD